MKRFLILFLLSGSLNALAQGSLSTGQSLVLEFNTTNPIFFTEGTGTLVYTSFGSDRLDPGDLLRLEFYENSLSDPILKSVTSIPGPDTLFFTSSSWVPFGPNCWGDRQGVIRFTMMSGSIDISGVSIHAAPSVTYYYDVVPIVVPEPSSLALFSAAACLFAGSRYWPGKAKTKRDRLL